MLTLILLNISMNYTPPQFISNNLQNFGYKLGDNCVQIFHLGRYIIEYRVGNLVILQQMSGDVKQDFQMYIQRYTSSNEKFEYGYPLSNALVQSRLKLDRCKPHKVTHHPMKCDIIYDLKLFPTVYHMIFCHKFSLLFNQTSHYKIKCIRI